MLISFHILSDILFGLPKLRNQWSDTLSSWLQLSDSGLYRMICWKSHSHKAFYVLFSMIDFSLRDMVKLHSKYIVPRRSRSLPNHACFCIHSGIICIIYWLCGLFTHFYFSVVDIYCFHVLCLLSLYVIGCYDFVRGRY